MEKLALFLRREIGKTAVVVRSGGFGRRLVKGGVASPTGGQRSAVVGGNLVMQVGGITRLGRGVGMTACMGVIFQCVRDWCR